jgi:PAS domain S-box-containing protein
MSAPRILIVEDNAATRKMMRLALQAEGYEVVEAEDAAQAVAVVSERAPALALVDCKLPDADGFELARRLRERLPALRLIAITGWAVEGDMPAWRACFSQVLLKPVAPSRLVEVVGALLEPQAAQGALRHKTVLVVDDDPAQRRLFEASLSSAGFRVITAESGERALQLSTELIPDAILSDVLMPGLDGFGLCRAVRANAALKDVPVVLMSAHYLEREDHELGERFGATRYVSRTAGVEQVLGALLDAFEAPSAPPRPGADDPQTAHLKRVARQLERQAGAGQALSRQVSRQATVLSVLNGFSESLSRQVAPENTLQHTLAECLDAAGLSVGAILLKKAAGNLTLETQLGAPSLADPSRHAELFERAMVEPGMVLPSDNAGAAGDALLAELEVRSALALPIVARDETFGVLLLASNRTDLADADRQEFVRGMRSVSRQLGQSLALSASFAKLTAAKRRYRALLENAHDAIAVLTPEGTVLEVNRSCERMLGRSRAELVGQTLAELAPEESRGVYTTEFVRSLADGGGRVTPGRLRRPDGTTLHVELSRTVVDVGGGERVVLSMGRDISDRVRLEEQLRQSQKMDAVGQLAGGVAHDFNNLLSIILSYTTLALDQLKPSDPLRSDIEQVKRAGERSAELTRQLLAFSRRQVLEPRVLDLNVAIKGAESMLRRVLGEDIELSMLTFTPVGAVLADPGQVEQILMNLLVNARDAMPRGGKLSIETADVTLDAAYASQHHEVTPGRYVMLAVSDTGVGMDSATLNRIFEPFFTTKEEGKGTGLGLATVFGIVKQSGGHIWVYSEPGRGSTFKIYLPRVEQTPEALTLAAPAATVGGSETVLLVEDHEQVRAIARTILGRNGYNVLEAQNGGEALLVCEQYEARIHLLITDVVMPRMSGKQLAERLAPLRPDMKVLFMSGYTDNTIVHHGVLDAGVVFLQKPITPSALLGKVREALGDARRTNRPPAPQ